MENLTVGGSDAPAHFAALEDSRQHAKVLYPLVEILLLALAATVAGANDFVETTLWGGENQTFLRRFFPYENGIPSHDTLCDVFAAIDPVLSKSCFLAWVEDLHNGAPEVIAIDGKTSRRSQELPRDANRVRALLEKPGLIDHEHAIRVAQG